MNKKLEEFLVAKGTTEELLKKHVVENASDILADKILNGKKNMKGCYNYIKGEAQKLAENGCAMIADDEVFAMAIEYFNNDDIKAEQEKVVAKVVAPKSSEDKTKEFLEEQTEIDDEPLTEEEYKQASVAMGERTKKIVERAEAKIKPKKITEIIKDMTPDEKLEYIIKNKKAKKVKSEEPVNQVSLFDF